ncbi:MAG: TraM recognition domain-containing protein [Candidatus Nomurabacteria bacterium]
MFNSQESLSGTGSEPRFSSPEEEIKFLREEISKRREATKNFGDRISKEDHVNDVLREHLSQAPKNILPGQYEVKDYEKKKLLKDLEEKKTDEQVSDLVSIMMDKGVHSAMSLVREMKDKEVESDFHRFIVNYLLTPHDQNIEKGLSKTEWKALHFKLYEIVLPEVKDKNDNKDPKKFIAFMEQFYASMLSIASDVNNKENNYYTLEMAKPNNSNEVSFFVSILNEMADLFEKTLFGLFPDAIIKYSKEDYNVFSGVGFQVAAYAAPVKTSALPFHTYDKMEGDPISLIISAFTKLQREGEGAALQIVVRPTGDVFLKKYSEMINSLKKGETLKRVLDRESFIKDFFATFKESTKSQEEIEKEKTKPKIVKIEDEKALANISKKVESTILDTNLRLIVNAPDLSRAKVILNELASTFRQYSEADGNSLQFKMLEGSKLNEVIHNYIYRLWDQDQSIPLNFKELATFYHLPSYVKDYNQLHKTDAATAPAPMDLPQTGLYLGTNEYRHLTTKVYLPEEDRLRHVYVIGQTGTGKSVMLKNMIIQDIVMGNGCCFIDPHGEDLLDIMGNVPKERWDDVVYFDPAYTEMPMGLNMLEFDQTKPEQKSFVINELFSIFKKLFADSSPESMGPAFEQYFRNSAGLVMEHPESGCTLIDISRVLSDKDYREYKLAHCKNPLINQFFKNAEATTGEQGFENFVPYITSKFDVFLSNEIMRPIISQEKSSFNIPDIMDNKKIFLVNLSKGRLGDINANLIGLILVGKFLMAALGREDPKNKPPFYLYLDEFQNISTPSISAILSEARKYKLSLTVAHQFIKQLDEKIKAAVFGNVGSKIVFRISDEDAKTLESSFAPTFTYADIMKIENLNAYVSLLIKGYPQKAFNIKEVYPPRGEKSTVDALKQLSYQRFGRPRAEVEEEVTKKFNLG